MYFASDNWAGAHPAIADAVLRDNAGNRPAYGLSDDDKQLDALFSDVFETDVSVFLVSTGTAANALALSAMAKPGAVLFCHDEAHVRVDECGAPLFYAAGMQLQGVAGPVGKIDINALHAAVETVRGGGLNAGRPGGLSLTQATESGTIYTLDEIGKHTALMKSHGLHTHMDGARFANALRALQCSPADMTWRQGIDALSFGGTKNGCWCAEAIILFNQDLARDMHFLRKRSGHLVSKMRFMTSQFKAYLADDLWLHLADRANAQATKLRDAVNQSNHARLAWDSQINEVFVIAAETTIAAWRAAGLHAGDWQVPVAEQPELLIPGQKVIRLVTSFATTDAEIDAFTRLIADVHETVITQ